MGEEIKIDFIEKRLKETSIENLKCAGKLYERYCFLNELKFQGDKPLENAKKLYELVLGQVKEFVRGLFDLEGGEGAFSKLCGMKPLLERFNLLKGPYQEIYEKVDSCLEEGHFYSINEDFSEIEKILSEM